jgi:hypothetical protein
MEDVKPKGHRFARGNAGGLTSWPECKCGVERRPVHSVGQTPRWEYRTPGGAWTREKPDHAALEAGVMR